MLDFQLKSTASSIQICRSLENRNARKLHVIKSKKLFGRAGCESNNNCAKIISNKSDLRLGHILKLSWTTSQSDVS